MQVVSHLIETVMGLDVMGFDVPESYTSYVIGKFNRAAQVLGERRDKSQRQALQVGVWNIGKCPIPVKKILLKPDTLCEAGCEEARWVGRMFACNNFRSEQF